MLSSFLLLIHKAFTIFSVLCPDEVKSDKATSSMSTSNNFLSILIRKCKKKVRWKNVKYCVLYFSYTEGLSYCIFFSCCDSVFAYTIYATFQDLNDSDAPVISQLRV